MGAELPDDGRYDAAQDDGLFGERAVERRGRGRPKGSINRGNAMLGQYLEQWMGEPLWQRMARLAYSDPLVLARAMGCEPVEALRLVQKAQTDLAPYVMVKLTPDVTQAQQIVILDGTGQLPDAMRVRFGAVRLSDDVRPADLVDLVDAVPMKTTTYASEAQGVGCAASDDPGVIVGEQGKDDL